MTRLDHISFTAQDPARLAAFYCELLEMRVLWELPDNGGTFLAGAERRESFDLSLFRAPPDAAADGGQATDGARRTLTSPHVALVVATLADLRDCRLAAVRLGGTYLFAINHGPALSCHILDPEGHHVELAWPTGRQVRRPLAAPIDLALPEEELLQILDASLA
jgi:catechol 2,3-dioxygenase-like lactoylglutathione lyase family enzyme